MGDDDYMIEYDYPLFRPPAEADNTILQITRGCSHNRCSFCSMYKTKKYSLRKLEDIYDDIDSLASYYPDTIKVFLGDGDALAAPTKFLLEVLDYLNKKFKKLRRVSLYASAQNILSKSEDELKKLYENKLTLLYYGIETGDKELLKKINKGVTKEQIISSLNKASSVGMKISSTVILGLGGKKYSKNHTKNTADIINNTKVTYLSTLQLGLEQSEAMEFYKSFDSFEHLSDDEVLDEQYDFISQIETNSKIIFRSNHASNALPLGGTLPRDKDKILLFIKEARQIGQDAYVPLYFRGF